MPTTPETPLAMNMGMPRAKAGRSSLSAPNVRAAGVGSTYKVLAKMPGGKKQGLFEITQWDPPHRYGYRSLEIAFPFKTIESTISLAPRNGGTQVILDAQFALTGLLSLAEGMFADLAWSPPPPMLARSGRPKMRCGCPHVGARRPRGRRLLRAWVDGIAPAARR
ncbi:MAG: SRPBCC family protein [Polyangiaceae bacterium]|nr:SRPBCC family protein [Polyangiaceae bacterium]